MGHSLVVFEIVAEEMIDNSPEVSGLKEGGGLRGRWFPSFSAFVLLSVIVRKLFVCAIEQ